VPRAVLVGFVVDKVKLGQGFVQVFQFLPILSHHNSPSSYITWGMNNWPVSSHSSETLSHLDMNNMINLLSLILSPYKTK
jgi:hypothetical protein